MPLDAFDFRKTFFCAFNVTRQQVEHRLKITAHVTLSFGVVFCGEGMLYRESIRMPLLDYWISEPEQLKL